MVPNTWQRSSSELTISSPVNACIIPSIYTPSLTMIIVHGTFPVKSDLRDEALKIMRRMAATSKAEYGCITYEFYVGLTDPNTLLLFQEWESVDALQGHFETSHMEDFLRKLPDVLDGEVSTRRYEVKVSNDLFDEHQEFETEPTAQPTYQEKIVH
ncbi:MAG: hypothetical protein CMQ19_07235 [Gammaproteobacteria bacterium]|nr:hypothetical protein [Gammaproteobacteria bacterium]